MLFKTDEDGTLLGARPRKIFFYFILIRQEKEII